MSKKTKTMLKQEREQQVVEHWEEYYSKRCEVIQSVSAYEHHQDKDGYYLYKVSVSLPDCKQSNFDFYSQFSNNNKMI